MAAHAGAAIITGGAGSFGRAIARRLMAEGHPAALLDVAGSDVGDLAGDSCRLFEVDLRDFESIPRVVKRVMEAFGDVFVLVNNVGVCPLTALQDMSPNEWRSVMDVNVGAAF